MASAEKIQPGLKIPTLNPNPRDQRLVEELFSTATAEQVAAFRRLTIDFASHVATACDTHIY